MRPICCKWAGAAKRHIPFLHLRNARGFLVHADGLDSGKLFTPDASTRDRLGRVFRADVCR